MAWWDSDRGDQAKPSRRPMKRSVYEDPERIPSPIA